MRILFENNYTLTDAMMLRVIKRISSRRLIWACFALSMLALVLILSSLVPPVSMASVLLYVMCFVVTGSGMFRIPQKVLKSQKSLAGATVQDETPRSIITFGEQIHSIRGGNQRSSEYSEITEVYDLGSEVVLSAGKFSHYIIDTNSFAKGTFEDWKQFITVQCPNAKYKRVVRIVLPIALNTTKQRFEEVSAK